MENAVENLSGGNEQNSMEGEPPFFTYLFRGFIFPCGSINFYKAAIRKKVIWAVAFFILFGFVFSVVQTIDANQTIKEMGDFIADGFENGDIPKMVIENGQLEVYEKQPIVYADNGVYMAIDTTGLITEIERDQYEQAMLFTKTEIHTLDDRKYEIYTYDDFHTLFGDPIYIDEDHVMNFWQSFSAVLGVIIFFSLCIWHIIIRFCYIAIIALVLWGVVSLIKDGVGYGPILISGLFANVPVMYIKTILSLLNFSFFLLYTFMLLIIWGIVLRKLFKKADSIAEPVVVSASGQTPMERIDYSDLIDEKREDEE